MKFIAFDLEGPLAVQDNAYELMKLFPGGDRVFEIISRYDDLLTLEGRPGYEPGDTLALIAPFLIYHGVKEEDISALARKATLVSGAQRLILQLNTSGWKVFCISTSYQQYARHIANRLNIFSQNLACTSFPVDELRQLISKDDFQLIEALEAELLSLESPDDVFIRDRLDRFYWRDIQKTSLARVLEKVKPIGGARKVQALEQFAHSYRQPLSTWVVVGDSITDFKMLKTVDAAGGLAVAFNANQYALPYATVGLASTHLDDLLPVLETWSKGGRQAVEKLVRQKETTGGSDNRDHFHWVSGRGDITAPLEIHLKIRKIVRQEAAKLG
jgi:energy-converting hydrogenase A subunit R